MRPRQPLLLRLWNKNTMVPDFFGVAIVVHNWKLSAWFWNSWGTKRQIRKSIKTVLTENFSVPFLFHASAMRGSGDSEFELDGRQKEQFTGPQGPKVCEDFTLQLKWRACSFWTKVFELWVEVVSPRELVNIQSMHSPYRRFTSPNLFSLWIYSTIHSQRTVQENQYKGPRMTSSKTFCSSVRFFKYTS